MTPHLPPVSKQNKTKHDPVYIHTYIHNDQHVRIGWYTVRIVDYDTRGIIGKRLILEFVLGMFFARACPDRYLNNCTVRSIGGGIRAGRFRGKGMACLVCC